MTLSLDKLSIRGFKSIRELDGLELKNLNILVGANGSGKSNFIACLDMLKAKAEGPDSLRSYINLNSGLKDLLYKGKQPSNEVDLRLWFGDIMYRILLEPGTGDSFNTSDNYNVIQGINSDGRWPEKVNQPENVSLSVGEDEGSYLTKDEFQAMYNMINSWRIYHFHESGVLTGMRNSEIIQDNMYLRPNASNIAPFLLRLRNEAPYEYSRILSACHRVAPYLEDFVLKQEQYGPKTKVSLTWKARGTDYPMQAYHLSDGTIRFICLATALLQPELPSLIIIDEPELGLHPTAIYIISELIEYAARHTQVIIATQSPLILDNFSFEDILVVERKEGQSTFERLSHDDFKLWLDEYSIGDLWVRGVTPGDVTYER